MSEQFSEWRQQLVKCIRCGTCRSVCPVFQVADNENTTARGKVKLIEAVTEGKLDLTPGMQERMSKCLLCKACAAGCPSGVKTDALFLGARRALAQKNGLPLVKKIAFTGLTYRKLFDLGLRTGAVFQNLIFKDSPDGRGKLSRIPLPAAGLNQRRLIPGLATTPLRSQLPRVCKVEKPKARAAFFSGCMLNYVYPSAGKAVVEILQANGIEVVLPPGQSCCGAPAYTSGDFAAGAYLAENNVKALSAENYDYIITACSTCGSSLKHEYGTVLAGSPVKDDWEKLSAKAYDISEFLVKFGYNDVFGEIKAKVTYHDPCHLVRGMNVSKQPRQLLRAIPGVEFVEMKDANKCCGCGGTFSAAYYDLSRKINDQKVNNAESTGADLLVTGCSACRMHITDGLSRHSSTIKVIHTAEIIAEAYRAGRGR